MVGRPDTVGRHVMPLSRRRDSVVLPPEMIRQLVRILGGAGVVAQRFGLSKITVKMWSYRAQIPRDRLEVLYRWLRER